MGKDRTIAEDQEQTVDVTVEVGNKSLAELALEATQKNLVKGRSSGRISYLDRFVGKLTDKDGNPVDAKNRIQIVSEISLDIAKETCQDEGEEFSFENEEHVKMFSEINNRVKNQVDAAISNSNNSTSLSYNEKYKNVYEVVKTPGSMVALARKTAE